MEEPCGSSYATAVYSKYKHFKAKMNCIKKIGDLIYQKKY